MKMLAGKVAFITGAASGIGLGIAQALGEAGMILAITDLQPGALQAAEAMLKGQGVSAYAWPLDVTDRAAYARVADQVEASLGRVHVLCNNAGIGIHGPMHSASFADWDWGLGVNLGGVVNGLQTWLPRMRSHGEGGHIVSTASAAGLFAGRDLGIYTAAKMAVVGIMECLRGELAAENIGVSVLCPHLVRTSIHEHLKLAPHSSDSAPLNPEDHRNLQAAIATGMDPLEVGRRVRGSIERNELYVLTHPEIRAIIEARFHALLAALPDELPDPRRVAAEAHTLHYDVYTECMHKTA